VLSLSKHISSLTMACTSGYSLFIDKVLRQAQGDSFFLLKVLFPQLAKLD